MSSRDDGARDERAERAQAEEQAWREIVEHYDDLPAVPLDGVDGPLLPGVPGAIDTEAPLDGAVASATAPAAPVDPAADPPELPARPVAGPVPEPEPQPEPDVFRLEPYDEQFVPPPLPPPPEISTDRRLAWVGLVAPPVLLLIVVILDYPLPSTLTGALVLAFLASFGYLVATMSTEPRDPDDDGARL